MITYIIHVIDIDALATSDVQFCRVVPAGGEALAVSDRPFDCSWAATLGTYSEIKTTSSALATYERIYPRDPITVSDDLGESTYTPPFEIGRISGDRS